jgi:hypothetical protein
MSIPELEHLAGTSLPEGTFTISDLEDEQLREVLHAPPSQSGVAHELWAYIATQRGIGISVADLCRIAQFDIADGPMLGSTELEYSSAMRIGTRYRVEGEVLGVERKHGRSGTFDVMRYRERLLSGDDLIASATSTFILPRRGG